MSKNNPFDIKSNRKKSENKSNVKSNKKPTTTKVKREYKKTTYNTPEIKSLLKGYILVQKDQWSSIPINSHIRYFRNGNVFRRGGFVTNHYEKNGLPFIHLATSRNDYKKGPKYTTWPLALSDTARIYMKPNKSSNIEMGAVQSKNTEIISQINKLVSVVKQQKIRIDKQEEDIRRLYVLLSRMSKLKNRSGTRSR